MAASGAKTDNDNLQSKLALRRAFLQCYHTDVPPRVIDACMGSGVIWKALRREFEVAKYLGLDVKRKRGRLAVDSRRFLKAPGWSADVVDVDTYGLPWKHWRAILAHAPAAPITVFMTIGSGTASGMQSVEVNEMCGFTPTPALSGKLLPHAEDHELARCLDRFTVAECLESTPGRSARYLGVHLLPR